MAIDRSERDGWRAVIVLSLCYILSLMDRQLLALLVEPIRHDLGLSDFKISLLQGLAFAIFYSVMGLPLGAIADRYNRKILIVVSVLLWSLMTALCGLASGFAWLFICRVGVGFGEASLSPAAFSIISDSFRRERVTRAIGVFQLSTQFGPAAAMIFGGSIAAAFANDLAIPGLGSLRPWQATFVMIGALGIPLSLLVLTLKEPKRAPAPPQAADIGALFTQLRAHRRWYVAAIGAASANAIAAFSVLAWVPTILTRVYHWPIGTIGLTIGGIIAVAGGSGAITGSFLADRRQRLGDAYAIPRIVAFSTLLCAPFVSLLLSETAGLFLSGVFIFAFFNAMPIGILNAGVQLTTPSRLRAKVAAVQLFIGNITAITAGPTIVAFFTDYIFQDPQYVAVSVVITAVAASVGACLLIMSGFTAYGKALSAIEARMAAGEAE